MPVLPAVREAVDAYLAAAPFPLAPDEPLFRAKRGGPLSPRHVQATVQRLRGRLGLPASATPHALRHCFATHLLGAGRRPALDPGTAGPRLPVDHPEIRRSER